MTVQPVGPGQQVAVPQNMGATGLDDMTQADLSIPRLQIVNKEGVFRDSLSGNKMQQINIIALGLVKQRTLWPAKVGDTPSKPMCRSNDFERGFVNVKQPQHPFPFQTAQLTQAHVQDREDGQLVFNCADCQLKEWNTHPQGDKPYCNEVWALPLLMDPFGNGSYLPAVLSLSKTNIGPAKRYLGGFKAQEAAAFTSHTLISLQLLSRGDNVYSNITFQRTEPTDSANWADWSALYFEMRAFLTQEPRVFEDDAPTGPPAAPQPTAAQPVQAQPVQAQPVQAQPVQAQPVQAQPVQAQPVQAQPVQAQPQTIVVQAEPVPQTAAAPMAADPNAPVDPWSQPGVTVDQAPVQPSQPMQAPAAVAQEAAPAAPAPVTAPVAAPAPVTTPVAPPAPAAVSSVPVTPPAPAAVPTPAPTPQMAAPAPQPAPSQVAPAPAPTVSVQAPTSPAVPAASVPAAPGDDELPF